jgi:hypothetical protein
MSLTNPTSADHIAGEQGSFTVQPQNNWSLEVALSGADGDLIVASLEAFTIPGATNEEIEVSYQNEVRKVAGRVTVDTQTLTLKDWVDQPILAAVLRWRKLVYDQATGKIGLAKNYKRTGTGILYAPDGSTERTVDLIGLWPTQDPQIALDMNSSEKVLLEVPLSCDKVAWQLAGL